MLSVGNDCTLVHHIDPIGIMHRRETVSDDDGRPACGGIADDFLMELPLII